MPVDASDIGAVNMPRGPLKEDPMGEVEDVEYERESAGGAFDPLWYVE